MIRRFCCVSGFAVFMSTWLLSLPALAQQASGIAGVVKDSSGAVLPGVTVEAASPALIEKVRSVITDGDGRYSVVDLRPGTYVVTFALPGFSTVRREGIELPGGFTATVNAELRVGALEETVTVTGAAPLVDTRNVQQRNAASADLLSALPTGLKAFSALMSLTPGLTPPTSGISGTGTSGVYRSSRQYDSAMHGKKNSAISMFDGMNVNGANQGNNVGYFANGFMAEEMTVETGGGSAETNTVSVAFDMIPKVGGNSVKGLVSVLFTNSDLQSSNLNDGVRARGLTEVPGVDRQYDVTGTLGGRIVRDKLWFFTAYRKEAASNSLIGVFANKTVGTPFYTPDQSRPGFSDTHFRNSAIRLTWQASPRNKVNVFADIVDTCSCPNEAQNTATEALSHFNFYNQALYQATWNVPLTSKLLLQTGMSAMIFTYDTGNPAGVAPPSPFEFSILDQRTGLRYNWGPSASKNDQPRWVQRFSANYVTGSHAFKAGINVEEAVYRTQSRVGDPVLSYTFLGVVPSQITLNAKPNFIESWLRPDLGVYAQDSWTRNRLTLNYGVRFDYFRGSVSAQHADAGPYVAARDFAAVDRVPLWTNINPRSGVSYDLFGTGRTALKATFGRYNGQLGANATAVAYQNNPMVTSVNTATRSWTDANVDYVPDCDFTDLAKNGECGAISNTNFGKANPNATRWADDVLRGWSARDYTWDMSAEVVHQLSAAMSVRGGYYRNWQSNFSVTDNESVTRTDYDAFCITAPIDARLPGGGGYPVCGMADVSPAKFGQVLNLVSKASHFGQQKAIADYFNASVNTRMGNGVNFGGGVDFGREVADRCFVVDSPQELKFCRVVTPFRATTQVKFFGSYPLPADIVVSGTLQNMPGAPILATYSATNAEIRPSLGRNLASCGVQATCTASASGIPLIQPMTRFEARRTQLSLRLAKIVRFGPSRRLNLNVDIYNALNRSDILTSNTNYGTSWLVPTQILESRLVQFSGEFNF